MHTWEAHFKIYFKTNGFYNANFMHKAHENLHIELQTLRIFYILTVRSNNFCLHTRVKLNAIFNSCGQPTKPDTSLLPSGAVIVANKPKEHLRMVASEAR